MNAKQAAAALTALLAALGGCRTAHPTPHALVAAHTALQRAQLGPARDQAPSTLARAEVGFATARATCARDPGSSRCRDAAYVARRRAEQAVAEASVTLAHRTHQRAHLALAARRAARQAPSLGGQEPTAPEGAAATATTAATATLAVPSVEADEVQAALRRLAPEVPVAHAPARGVVIRLSRRQAFADGASLLLPQARRELARIVRALQGTPRGALQVASVGADADDHGLARARAQAVMAYLIGCGLPATRLRPAETTAPDDAAAARHDVELVWQAQAALP